MEFNKLILLCVCVVAIVVISCACIWALSSGVETNLVASATTINQGENFTVTLSDNEGNKLTNKNVSLTINNSNNQSKEYNLTTDNNGMVSLPINLPSGNYSILSKFNGVDGYKSSTLSQDLIVTSLISQGTKSSNSDSSISSSSNGPETFGVCVYCGKVVPGKWGRICCDSCQKARDSGDMSQIQHTDESKAYIDPNGRVSGDGDHSDVYHNYMYDNL